MTRPKRARRRKAIQPIRVAEAHAPAVVIVDPNPVQARRTEEMVAALGLHAVVLEAVAATRVVDGTAPPDIVMAELPGGEEPVRAAAARGTDRPSVIVSVAPSQDGARAAEEHGADAWVTRPHKRDALAALLRAAARLRAERRRAVEEVDPLTGFPPLDFWKKLLLIEIKRAKRYGYPLAACMVALDGGTVAAAPELHRHMAQALGRVVRDIDMPVAFADGRFLIFLPYTDLLGAERVGRRLEAASRPLGVSLSVGIAALVKGKRVSFAKLVRDAAAALRAAQLKGGGQMVIRA